MKKIAIITGASSGMGKVFAETINTYDTFDEVWVIARRLDRLESLQETVPFPVRPIALDPTAKASGTMKSCSKTRRQTSRCSSIAAATASSRLPVKRPLRRISTWSTSTARRSWPCAS